MANEITGLSITRLSSGDMSDHQYAPVVASTANAAKGAAIVTTLGAKLTGIWQHNSTASEYGRVQITGVTPVLAGATGSVAITEGTILVCGTGPHARPSTAAGQHVIGQALESLSTGSTGVISALLMIGAIST